MAKHKRRRQNGCDRLLTLMLYDPPQLNDEMAAQMVWFLQDLLESIERHYAPQMRRHLKKEKQLEMKLPF
jgi:hypothetical protein